MTMQYDFPHAKSIMICIAAILFVSSLLLLYLTFSQKPAVTQAEKEEMTAQITTTIPLSATPLVSPKKVSPTPQRQLSWVRYETKDFVLFHPVEWEVVTRTPPDSAIVIFGPDLTTGRTDVPSFAIEMIDKKTNSLDSAKVQVPFINKGYRKTTFPSNGQNTIKLSGTYPSKRVAGQILLAPVQETHIYGLEKGDYTYLLHYTYDGTLEDLHYEALFGQMLSTFILK